jgi:putative ABC transport system permease protein
MRFFTFLLKNLFRRKVRTALTCVGVAVAVGTLVALLGIADGFERSSAEAFEKRGVDLVVIKEGATDQLGSIVDEAVVDRIAKLPGVKAVGPGLVDLIELPRGGTTISAFINGWRLDSFLFDELKIVDGRKLKAADDHAVMLGKNLAQNLRKQVGDVVKIDEEDFRVVGVFESFNFFENTSLIMALPELQRLRRNGRHEVTGFSINLDHAGAHPVDADTVAEQIKKMTDPKGRPLRLSAKPSQEFVSSSAHIRIAHGMAWMTSVIAVIIGAIGMLNTMIMSVFERVKEIGILRAIGWRRSRVMRMILGEALLLSLAGAVLGVLLALGLTNTLSKFPEAASFIEGTIAPAVIARGFLMALLVGLIGGLYPAYRASRLLPTEALRHE